MVLPRGLAEAVSLGATLAFAPSTPKQPQERGSDALAPVDGLRTWLSPQPCSHPDHMGTFRHTCRKGQGHTLFPPQGLGAN